MRVASYRQLQAISQQINFLTNGRLGNLDAFKVPDNVVVTPVPHGCTRFSQMDNGRVRAGYRDNITGETRMLLPAERDWWVDTPLLVLQLDQGPTCCGGAASLV